MANRLSVITTRTGDDGSTGLGDGSRVPKDDPRIMALGDVDEFNSTLGLLRCEALPDEVSADLLTIQHDLFDMGTELCIPGHAALSDEQVAYLDARLAFYNAALPPLREFILPGGTRAAALAHLARTAARRAERSVIALAAQAAVNAPLCQYLNRSSDLMFVLARYLNQSQGQADIYWSSRHSRVSGA
ncbi:cob(I)yrinic acid a,c-diamide adenosyltransferase [Bordetella avium]|uniref:cob(I)yrinic acid a,c-diamide adenosyltransferase n=2 Tax=Bordetella avium TaxID=521 RepID=UPI000E0A6E10|nr:cob(I)yrinic acid a,c-diamide adenosyltransferase [Bordetella avium]RIQ14959.1 cob(I)yrinic acid a,c-diamide adenosyltransferase [Bordetella avium]RIQ41422.1 cob(I)yrinic acid a,c-diamide adenosyltransferase [Bordetella avium]RIQ45788.1 cob(I)yrinic acid a,c-diamide adenosyltransferase [Bordetella avium]RIQ46716.1 cob(I)yrinic acid a,c-diamide adenosyltransferase [Bordetella avium]RIQ49759.1 cob(I)yrinic acid a,c-diamide adenosyltransferase [Bordetella avium]